MKKGMFFAAILVAILASCSKEVYEAPPIGGGDVNITVNYGDTTVNYGDTITNITVNYGDTITNVTVNGNVVTVGAGGVYVEGNFYEVGSLVVDFSTKTTYVVTVTNNTYVLLVYVNMCYGTCFDTVHTVIDSVLYVHEDSCVIFGLTLPKSSFCGSSGYFAGQTGIGLIASGRIYSPWGVGNGVFGRNIGVVPASNGGWDVTTVSSLGDTAVYNVQSGAIPLTSPASTLFGSDFPLTKVSGPSSFSWEVPFRPQWAPSQGVGYPYIALSKGVHADAQDFHLVRGVIKLPKTAMVFDHANKAWYTAAEFAATRAFH